MDNLGSHKAPAIRNAITAAGARLLFLPALAIVARTGGATRLAARPFDALTRLPRGHGRVSPIEQVFAKLKHLLRKAAERGKEAVWRRIGSLLDQVSAQECENYLRNAGYSSI